MLGKHVWKSQSLTMTLTGELWAVPADSSYRENRKCAVLYMQGSEIFLHEVAAKRSAKTGLTLHSTTLWAPHTGLNSAVQKMTSSHWQRTSRSCMSDIYREGSCFNTGIFSVKKNPKTLDL